ncbi:DDE-type integrase/transposase/recombinase [Siccirubricoccus sp. G192]|uniref:DDE-type integrase/transposase/recombinase n=1 Tax=Siccirubricoccus sp. G192 TaxID=2849651 RepID=UPI001C2C9549|nr:DDE-type integrase/transposase/recombinase [Siccirubricoccus sp. G192]MBV1800515.1 DDE-type integrase/transposase/recombinase [Siccirubricoccus sp. G192]
MGVELILAERGIGVTHESIRQWCLRFGADFACKLRRRRPRPGDTWYLDEVYLRMNGQLHYLWRAVDRHGVVFDILVQDRRNATTAKHIFKRLLAGLKFKPSRIITDDLRSYSVAQREVLPEVKHRTSHHGGPVGLGTPRLPSWPSCGVVKRGGIGGCRQSTCGHPSNDDQIECHHAGVCTSVTRVL